MPSDWNQIFSVKQLKGIFTDTNFDFEKNDDFKVENTHFTTAY